jgi:uncharacterized protein YkwD
VKYFVLLQLLALGSCVSPQVYRQALEREAALQQDFQVARKALKATDQRIAAVSDSLNILTAQIEAAKAQASKLQANQNDTNSAANASWMSTHDREVIYWLNVARLDPSGFFRRFIAADWAANPTNSYLNSLKITMNTMKPVAALQPDRTLYEAAMCHARSSGIAGYVGHNRVNTQCKKIYYGECCSYGAADALNVVIQLLVDEGVPSLGHREICLSASYTTIGAASATHAQYRTNTVLDFR